MLLINMCEHYKIQAFKIHKDYTQNIWYQHTIPYQAVYINFAASSNLKLTDIYKINSMEKLMSMWTREWSEYAM